MTAQLCCCDTLGNAKLRYAKPVFHHFCLNAQSTACPTSARSLMLFQRSAVDLPSPRGRTGVAHSSWKGGKRTSVKTACHSIQKCSCGESASVSVLSISEKLWIVLEERFMKLQTMWSDSGVKLTKHSRSLAGRDMMMKSFLTSSMTKVSSELSERS